MYPSKDAAKSFLFVPNNKSTLYLLESTEDQHAVGDSDGHFVSPWLVRRLVSIVAALAGIIIDDKRWQEAFQSVCTVRVGHGG